jgi:hypothetical protein
MPWRWSASNRKAITHAARARVWGTGLLSVHAYVMQEHERKTGERRGGVEDGMRKRRGARRMRGGLGGEEEERGGRGMGG